MIKNVYLAALTSLALVSPVLAQSGSDGADPQKPDAVATGAGGVQDVSAQSWSEDIRNVFFVDETMTTMRPMGEIEPAWQALPMETRELAKWDCQAFLMDAGSMGAGSQGGVNADTKLSPEAEASANAGQELLGTPANPDTEADSAGVPTDTTTARNTPPSPGDATAWNQVCSLAVSFDTPRGTSSSPGTGNNTEVTD